jgi:acetyl-CoA carboxylase carboxyltransferase component
MSYSPQNPMAKDNRSEWEPWLQNLERRRARSLEMGGPDRVERLMTARGKLDARQRMQRLFDPGTFVEIGGLVGTLDDIPADGFIAGHGTIDGRRVLAGAEDFSTLGGSIGQGGTSKRHRIAELALQERVPLVVMLDGAGARLTERHGGRSPTDLLALADLRGHVPMVCLVLGASAGHGALVAPLSDYVVMTEQAAMFTGGPPLVKAATGEDVTKEELGGVKVCVEVAGTVHDAVPDDAAALDRARRYLSYFPSSRDEQAPSGEGADTGPRSIEKMLDLIPANDRKPYAMRSVLEQIIDAGSLFEIQARYGRSLITALAHLGGRAVAIVANDPSHRAGAVDSAAAIKATGFLETLAHFGLPVLFFIDNPGVLAGTRAERDGILKWGGKMFLAERRLPNPKVAIQMRKGFGFGLVTMGGLPFDDQTMVYSLPSVNLAAMPAESGGRAANLDPAAQAQAEEAQRSGPYQMANHLGVDDVIDPRELRNKLLEALRLQRG